MVYQACLRNVCSSLLKFLEFNRKDANDGEIRKIIGRKKKLFKGCYGPQL